MLNITFMGSLLVIMAGVAGMALGLFMGCFIAGGIEGLFNKKYPNMEYAIMVIVGGIFTWFGILSCEV